MKRMIKYPFTMIWRMAHPIRRPVIRRLGDLIRDNAVQPPPQVHISCHVPESTNLIMDHLIRELVRLQSQVERLQQTLEDLIPSTRSLTVVRPLDVDTDDDSYARSAAG